jgi:hypothetical protein
MTEPESHGRCQRAAGRRSIDGDLGRLDDQLVEWSGACSRGGRGHRAGTQVGSQRRDGVMVEPADVLTNPITASCHAIACDIAARSRAHQNTESTTSVSRNVRGYQPSAAPRAGVPRSTTAAPVGSGPVPSAVHPPSHIDDGRAQDLERAANPKRHHHPCPDPRRASCEYRTLDHSATPRQMRIASLRCLDTFAPVPNGHTGTMRRRRTTERG